MTILMITGIFPPDIGGPASYVPAIAQALTERGHRVCVITLSDRLDHDDEAHGYRVIRIPRRQPRLYRMMKTVLTILRMGQDAEVLFVNGLALESVLANLLLNKRLVQKVVGDVAWERARTFGRSDETIDAFQTTRGSLRVQLLKQLRSFWVRQSHTVFAPSRYLQNIILGWGLDERKVRVIYNAVEAVPVAAPEKHPALQDVPADARVIVSIGRLVLWKGFDELIEVMDGIPEAQLFILGDGPRRGGLEELARRQSCRQR
ncbi:MAG: glycosyltransferase family 4 protein, partial [Deltaproteobacteria bacterium]|nr:glycosyltransferase family 4 protein [Deltaproteobacteria bacterium]